MSLTTYNWIASGALYQSIYPDTKYEFIEKTYIILSLVAKTTLGAFMAYGAAGGQQRF